MNKTSIASVILIAIVMLTACNRNNLQPPNDLIGADVQAENWNTSIKLIDDPILSSSHRNGQDLTLTIENLSDTIIVFPDNFGIKVLTLGGQNWVSVQNNFYNTGQYILPTKKSYPLGLLITALPYVPNLTSSIKIRVIIVGHAENNDKEPLGAYLDVALNP